MKKDEILDAALVLFANQGYAGTSMNQIAEAVGLKKPTLYTHFKSKLDIYSAVIQLQILNYNACIFSRLNEYENKPLEFVLKDIFLKSIEYNLNKNNLLFWTQVFLLSATDFKSESVEISKKMAQDVSQNAVVAFDRLVDKNINNYSEILQSVMLSFMVIIHGFMDWMLIYFNSGLDILKVASDHWDFSWKNADLSEILKKK